MVSSICPKTGLLVLNSLSFVFQSHPDLSSSKKNAILGDIRRNLLDACIIRNVTVIVTSQMATKMLHPDGSPATFDSGTKAVMVPRLGIKYLPLGRLFRIIIVPQSRRSGIVRLVSSPSCQQHQNTLTEERYILVRLTNMGFSNGSLATSGIQRTPRSDQVCLITQCTLVLWRLCISKVFGEIVFGNDVVWCNNHIHLPIGLRDGYRSRIKQLLL